MELHMDYFATLVWPGGGTIGLMIWGQSIAVVALLIQYIITIRRQTWIPDVVRQQIQSLFDNKQYREVIELTAAEPSLLSNIVHAGLTEAAYGYNAMEEAMEEAAQDRSGNTKAKLEWMNVLGNTGPMLGLLGTVWGMILMFMKITALNKMPPASMLAEEIGIALVTTLLGLCVAIPALTIYSIYKNRVDQLTSEALDIAAELIGTFRPTPKSEK